MFRNHNNDNNLYSKINVARETGNNKIKQKKIQMFQIKPENKTS